MNFLREFPSKNLKTQPGFFLPQNIKIQEERDKSKKELLSKNKPAFDNLGNSRSLQITVQSVAGRQCPKEIRYVIYVPNQPSQQKPGIQMWLSRKDLWKSFLSAGSDSIKLHRRLTKNFENFVPAETLLAWAERNRDSMK